MFKYEENEADVTTFPGKKDCAWNCNNSVQLAKILFHCHYRQLNLCIYLYMYQEFITVRVCNSHMATTWTVWGQSNMLSCENTGSLVFRPSHCPVFDRLQYAKTEGGGLVHWITSVSIQVDKGGRGPQSKEHISCMCSSFWTRSSIIFADQKLEGGKAWERW